MRDLTWAVDPKAVTDLHRSPVVASVVDPLDGVEYALHTDQKYLDIKDPYSHRDILPYTYPDGPKRSWQVIPLLTVLEAESPGGAYHLFPNFDPRLSYQVGPGLVPRYVGHARAHDGDKEVGLEIHRRPYGSEETELRSRIYRLLGL